MSLDVAMDARLAQAELKLCCGSTGDNQSRLERIEIDAQRAGDLNAVRRAQQLMGQLVAKSTGLARITPEPLPTR